MRWLKDAFIESLNQGYTLLGFFVAWVLLEGSARTIVGYAVFVTTFIHLVTIRLREDKDKKSNQTSSDE
jgi:hypothetical protein